MRKTLGGLALLSSLATGVSLATAEPPPQQPPPILLKSMAGTQTAAEGSFCVSVPGVTLCGDYPDPEPARLSVVRPWTGRVRIVLPKTVSVEGDVFVERRGCRPRVVQRFPLTGTTTRWRVTVRSGVYELSAFATFATADGRSGDTSGALGLLVDRDARRRIIPARDRLACRAR